MSGSTEGGLSNAIAQFLGQHRLCHSPFCPLWEWEAFHLRETKAAPIFRVVLSHRQAQSISLVTSFPPTKEVIFKKKKMKKTV